MSTIRNLALCCFFLHFLTAVSAQSQDDQAQALLDELVQSGQTVGVVAGYSVLDKSKWISGSGYMNLEENKEVSNDMITRCASIAKPMTATAVLQLAEKGLLDLDAPIQKYIPEYPKKKEGTITVRHLLTHASGIGAYKSSRERENSVEYESIAEAVEIFSSRELLAAPGVEFYYSSYGYVVLGLIIEQVSDMSYADYMQENVWTKAGMSDTGVEKFGTEYPNKSKVYHRSKKGKVSRAKMTNLSDRVPGGGFYTTAEDLLKFGEALLSNTLISQTSFEEMMKDTGLKKQGNPYGLGWYLYGKNPKYGNVIGHSGTQIGASAQLMILPEVNTVIIVMSNTSGIWGQVFGVSVKLFDVAASSYE